MLDLQEVANALKWLGITAEASGFNKDALWTHLPIYGPTALIPGEENPWLEVTVRSAVIKKAPGSYAMPPLHGERGVTVVGKDAAGQMLPGLDARIAWGDTYTEAWIQASVALYRSYGGEA